MSLDFYVASKKSTNCQRLRLVKLSLTTLTLRLQGGRKLEGKVRAWSGQKSIFLSRMKLNALRKFLKINVLVGTVAFGENTVGKFFSTARHEKFEKFLNFLTFVPLVSRHRLHGFTRIFLSVAFDTFCFKKNPCKSVQSVASLLFSSTNAN